MFAGLLTKVGVAVILRFTSLMFPATNPDAGPVHELIVLIACLTMLTGVLSAAAQGEIRRILSFHIISQIGYMLMGIGIAGTALAAAAAAEDPARAGELRDAGTLAMTGTIFYILHHIVVKANLFLVAGIIERRCGTGRLDRLGGLAAASPRLAVLFMVPALSLAGIPVLSGFWSKFILVRAGLEAGANLVVAVSLLVSVLTLFSMMKIWIGAFWKPAPDAPAAEESAPAAGDPRWMEAGSAFLAVVTLAIGLLAGPAVGLAERASRQMIDGRAYRNAAMDRAGATDASDTRDTPDTTDAPNAPDTTPTQEGRP